MLSTSGEIEGTTIILKLEMIFSQKLLIERKIDEYIPFFWLAPTISVQINQIYSRNETA